MNNKELAKKLLGEIRKKLGYIATRDKVALDDKTSYVDAEQVLEVMYLREEYGMVIALCNVIERIIEYYHTRYADREKYEGYVSCGIEKGAGHPETKMIGELSTVISIFCYAFTDIVEAMQEIGWKQEKAKCFLFEMIEQALEIDRREDNNDQF